LFSFATPYMQIVAVLCHAIQQNILVRYC